MFRLLMLWVMAVLCGFGYLMVYANTPAGEGRSAQRWPAASRIHRGVQRPTLMMFIHPQCPCTRASLEELSRIVARCRDRADVHIVAVLPKDLSIAWEDTDLYSQARAIPGVDVDIDECGVEACRFGATTSGYTLLYDVQGDLLFAGGITAARGHAGDNVGKDAVIRWIEMGQAELRNTAVFGCGLFDVPSDCKKGEAKCHK